MCPANPETWLAIRGSDTLLFRDGRPFSNEAGAQSAMTLSLPLPSTVAGMLRTRLGNAQGWKWTEAARQEEAQRIVVHGPLLVCNDTPVFPAPADALIYDKEGKNKTTGEETLTTTVMCLRPGLDAGTGCDLPDAALLPLRVTDDAKPKSGYAYWPEERILAWLTFAAGENFTPPDSIVGPQKEERVHVGIDPKTGGSEKGQLFTAQFLSLARYPRWQEAQTRQEWSLRVRLETPTDAQQETQTNAPVDMRGLATFGGERRLAVIENGQAWASCPDDLKARLHNATHVRMLLTTPAIFMDGWKPGWLDDTLQGVVPGTSVRVRLKAAAVKRREAVSGWDYRVDKNNRSLGPKPVRWLTPAGSVYFFEVMDDSDAQELADKAWMRSVSDALQDCRDGFGLALWGVW